MNPEDEAEEDGANIDLDSQRKGKCVVLKTSTRQVREDLFVHSFILLNSIANRTFGIQPATAMSLCAQVGFAFKR